MANDTNKSRSNVRIRVTYLAALFIFLGGGTIITYAIYKGDMSLAKDTFNVILPIATGVVTYWFAGRSAEKASESNQSGKQDGGQNISNQGDNQ